MIPWRGKGLSIGDLTARLPIIQGGMGIGVSLSGLASQLPMKGYWGYLYSYNWEYGAGFFN